LQFVIYQYCNLSILQFINIATYQFYNLSILQYIERNLGLLAQFLLIGLEEID